jgi:hypothetical protein
MSGHSGEFQRDAIGGSVGPTRWILTPTDQEGDTPAIRRIRAFSRNAAAESGFGNIIFTDDIAVRGFAERHNILFGNDPQSASRLNAISAMIGTQPEFAMNTGGNARNASNVFNAVNHWTLPNTGVSAYALALAPGSNSYIVHLGRLGQMGAQEHFAAFAGLPLTAVTNINASAEQYEDFIIRHEIDHIDGVDEFTKPDRIREERGADIAALSRMQANGAFNTVSGFTDEIRYARAISVMTTYDFQQHLANPNNYVLSGSFDGSGRAIEPTFDPTRVAESAARMLATVNIIDSATRLPAGSYYPPGSLQQLFGEIYNNPPTPTTVQARNHAIDGFNRMQGFNTDGSPPDRAAGLTRMYENVYVLNEAGAFRSNLETQAMVNDYLTGMQRYSSIPQAADLAAARQRLGPYTTPDAIATISNFNAVPWVQPTPGPAATTTAGAGIGTPP